MRHATLQSVPLDLQGRPYLCPLRDGLHGQACVALRTATEHGDLQQVWWVGKGRAVTDA